MFKEERVFQIRLRKAESIDLLAWETAVSIESESVFHSEGGSYE
jgi:hypothetical protein